MKDELVAQLVGARIGVDVMTAAQGHWTFPVTIEQLAESCSRRLAVRYLLRGISPGSEASFASDLYRIVGRDWQLRATIPDQPSVNCIVIDSRVAFMTDAFPPARLPHAHLVTEPLRVGHLVDKFERLWTTATEANRSYFIFEDELERLPKDETARINTLSREFWDQLIRSLASRPEDLFKVSPRKFEELIVELLIRDGLNAVLTPQTRDGGRDILVSSSSPLGDHLFLVECKRHARNRPVDVGIVRELFGVLGHERATGALIATTSYFTKDALKFREPIQYQMNFKDFDAIAVWLQRTATIKSRG